MKKTLLLLLYFIMLLPAYGQRKFPSFNYTTLGGDTLTQKTLLNQSTLIVVGHLSCPGMLLLMRDIQRANIDTLQLILLLENTKEQVVAFNEHDTIDIWGLQRYSFKMKPLECHIVTFCDREKLGKRKDGTVIIKPQCNKLKVKYGAFEVPKIYAINNRGQIVNKQTGWYYNLPNPQQAILQLFKLK